MHDDYIVSYSVDIEKKKVQINTCNHENKKRMVLLFSEVLTHSFNCILECNILLDVTENDVELFIKNNSVELEEMKNFCWPINYDRVDELINYLVQNEYRYYVISSSLGMSGWVLAKSFDVEDIKY